MTRVVDENVIIKAEMLDIIVAHTTPIIRLDIVSELTNKRIEFRQSRCFQKV